MFAWLPAVPVIAYVIAGIASTWLGFWYFQAFAWGSAALATIAAIRMREYWPVVYPTLSIFYVFPALLIAYWLVVAPLAYLTADPISDWLPWFGTSVVVAAMTTAILVFRWRRYIDREWAVVTTFFVVLVYAAWTLESLNANLSQPAPRCEQVQVLNTSPGGYRQGGPRVTIAASGPYHSNSTHPATWSTLIAAGRNEPICLYIYRGALGWRWVQLAHC